MAYGVSMHDMILLETFFMLKGLGTAKTKEKKTCSMRKTAYITTLRAKEVANMPLRSTCYNYLALNGSLATLTTRTERLVKIQMAIEAQRVIAIRVGARLCDFFACEAALNA